MILLRGLIQSNLNESKFNIFNSSLVLISIKLTTRSMLSSRLKHLKTVEADLSRLFHRAGEIETITTLHDLQSNVQNLPKSGHLAMAWDTHGLRR